MFQETVEDVLEFIGSHGERGCEGASFLDFVAHDLLPHYGLAGSAPLQEMLLGLVVAESKSGAFTLLRGNTALRAEEVEDVTNNPFLLEHCVLAPTLVLQERVLGISLHLKLIREAVNYFCAHLIDGVPRYRVPSPDRRVALPAPSHFGIRRLLRDQFLRIAYIFDAIHGFLLPHFFTHFAAPTPTGGAGRGARPLDAYIARRRALTAEEGRVFFDLRVVREVVASAPEQRLVREDAVHSIFAAHGVKAGEGGVTMEGRRLRVNFDRMLDAAGLRTVRTAVNVGRRRRLVRVVVLDHEEMNAAEVDGEDDDEDNDNEKEDDTDGEREEGKAMDTRAVASAAAAGTGSEEESAGSESEGEEEEDEGNDEPGFPVDPHFPLPLQVSQEAERRPLPLESILPRTILYDGRVAENELNRYTKQYEERWGTIQSTRVLSRHCKAFTRLLRPTAPEVTKMTQSEPEEPLSSIPTSQPVPTSNEVNMGTIDGKPVSLPRGVTQWAIDRVLTALRNAPGGALSLPDLASVVDRSTLRRRLLPFLRTAGVIATTGVNAFGGKRVGIVALAGADISDAAQLALAKERAERLANARRQRVPVILRCLPDAEFFRMSAANVARLTDRAERLVSRVTMMRNGFSRRHLTRTARLHLEMWHQWLSGNNGVVSPESPRSVAQLFHDMSLSTFCVVVGLSGVDVTTFLKGPAAMTWNTPIRELPPSLQEHCRRAGPQTLLHALAELQSEGLVTATRPLAAFMQQPLEDVTVSLVSTVGSARGERGFIWRPETAPNEVCRVLLRYWAERCSTSYAPSMHRRCAELISSSVNVEPNLSNVQIIALAHISRMEVGAIAEYTLQRHGTLPGPHHALLDAIRPKPRKCASSALTAGGAHVGPSPVRRRFEVTGAAVAEALEAVLQTDEPFEGIKRLATAVRRGGRGRWEEGRYSPYGSRVHSSVLSLMDSIVETMDTSGRSDGAGALQSVAAVVSPNYAAAPTLSMPQISRRKTTEAQERDMHDLTPTADLERDIDGPYKTIDEAVEVDEDLQDVIRMILLSDEAHFDAAAAETLLSQYSEEARVAATESLLRYKAFRLGHSSGRVRRINISPVFSLVPATVASGATHARSRTASFVHDITASLLTAPPSQLTSHSLLPFDCVAATRVDIDCDPSNPIHGHSPSYQDPNGATNPDGAAPCVWRHAPRLVRQPTLNMDSLASEVRKQHGLSVLRLPRFAWPAGPDRRQEIGVGVAPDARLSVSASRRGEPHPARGILRRWRRLARVGLGDIPADAPPALRGDAPPLRYPSIFFHVDGAFHEFIWRSVLFAAYALVQHQPGISAEELTRKLMANGIVSHAACRTVIDFLKASLVVVPRRLLVEKTEGQSPFADSSGSSSNNIHDTCDTGNMNHTEFDYRECYYCSVPHDGPWSIIEL